ncbi:hypothetical protein CAPTEDRAFT_66322, partial [Capitella teleta]
MEKIVRLLFNKNTTRNHRDDDFVDRLSHRYTCVLLVAFAIMSTARQYMLKPITCWAPKHFTGSHTKFSNSYCWVKNTYYLDWDKEIPKEHEEEKRATILYYQWVPFILLLQAVFFYMPTVIWHALNSKGGIDSDDILCAAGTFQNSQKVEKREFVLKLICTQLHRFLTGRLNRGASWKLNMRNCMNNLGLGCCGKRLGNYLAILFVVSKLFFVGNVLFQLFVLNQVFKTSFNTFGVDYFDNLNSNDEWWLTNPIFPRVTFCDFNVRRLGNVHRYTLQCVLPSNLYVEKMYVFLWYWMVGVAIMSCVSLATWMARFCSRADRRCFLKNHLLEMDKLRDNDADELLDEFLDVYLRQDGGFILRLIAHNTNHITTTEVICALWDYWLSK